MADRSVNEEAVEPRKDVKQQVEVCAHCGAENPPGLLLCLECGRSPSTGRDLFAAPDVPVPDQSPLPVQTFSASELTVNLPDPIEVPEPLPIPTLENFVAPPPQPHPTPPPVYRAPPSRPKKLVPLLGPLPRWIIIVLGLGVLTLVGLGIVGSIVTYNLPGGVCLGSVWLFLAIGWLAIVLARRGDSRNETTGAYRRLVTSFGRRLFEITPQQAREQRARLPAKQAPAVLQPASQLLYLASGGDRMGQLAQVMLGTLCALVAGEQIELMTQTYDVLTASPLRESIRTIKRAAVTERTLYVGAGYLESLIMEQLRHSPTTSARDLATGVLHQAGEDLFNRIATQASQTSAPQSDEATDLDAQVAALRDYCEEFRALNPDLYEQLSQEVEEATREFMSRARQRAGRAI
jgi:ribosomal protein L40E